MSCNAVGGASRAKGRGGRRSWLVFWVTGALTLAPVAHVGAVETNVPAELDLACVPADATMVIAIGARAIGQPIAGAFEAVKADASDGGELSEKVQRNLLQVMGAPPEAIEQVTEVIGQPPARPGEGLKIRVVRTRRPHDFRKSPGFFPADAQPKTHTGQTYYESAGDHPHCYFFADERTVVVCDRVEEMKWCLDSGRDGAAKATWVDTWNDVRRNDFAMLVDLDAARRAAEAAGVDAGGPAAALGALWQKPRILACGVQLAEGLTLQATATCENAADAEAVQKKLDEFLGQGEGLLAMGRKSLADDRKVSAAGKPLVLPLFDLGGRLLKTAQVERASNQVKLQATAAGDGSIVFGPAWVLPQLARLAD